MNEEKVRGKVDAMFDVFCDCLRDYVDEVDWDENKMVDVYQSMNNTLIREMSSHHDILLGLMQQAIIAGDIKVGLTYAKDEGYDVPDFRTEYPKLQGVDNDAGEASVVLEHYKHPEGWDDLWFIELHSKEKTE